MLIEQIIPYETKEGNKYLIEFKAWENDAIPEGVNIPIIDLQLVEVELKVQNGTEFLRTFLPQYICDYVDRFDVILYYYCDSSDIQMRKTRKMSPQEYRNCIFKTMYNTIGNDQILRKPIIIEDDANGPHFMSLVTSIRNEKQMEIASKAIKDLSK